MALNDDDAGGDGGAGAGSAADLLGGAAAGTGAGGEGAAAGAGEGGGDTGAGMGDPDWYAQLSADAVGEEPSLRDWVKSIGAKDLDGLAKIARDNQKAVREGGRVKVPGEGASQAEVAEFRKAIGVPEKADGYKLPALKDAEGNDVPMNNAKLAAITAAAHKHGIPAGALEATLQEIAQADANDLAATEIELTQKAEAHVKTWGADKAAKLEAIDQVASKFGLSRDNVLSLRAAWGPEKALDFLATIGSGMREDTLVDGSKRQRFGVDATAAQAELDTMKSTPGMADKIGVPGSAERMRWDRLSAIVGEAANRKAAQT
jgi:hypothetical protein